MWALIRMVRVLVRRHARMWQNLYMKWRTTHTARKTLSATSTSRSKTELVASMSGHSEGSRAFARYRHIDDEIKKELVNLLD